MVKQLWNAITPTISFVHKFFMIFFLFDCGLTILLLFGIVAECYILLKNAHSISPSICRITAVISFFFSTFFLLLWPQWHLSKSTKTSRHFQENLYCIWIGIRLKNGKDGCRFILLLTIIAWSTCVSVCLYYVYENCLCK